MTSAPLTVLFGQHNASASPHLWKAEPWGHPGSRPCTSQITQRRPASAHMNTQMTCPYSNVIQFSSATNYTLQKTQLNQLKKQFQQKLNVITFMKGYLLQSCCIRLPYEPMALFRSIHFPEVSQWNPTERSNFPPPCFIVTAGILFILRLQSTRKNTASFQITGFTNLLVVS